MNNREQLRERLAGEVARHLNYGDSGYVSELDRDLAGDILAEIEAAGYVLLERGESVDLHDKEAWGSVWETVDDVLGVRLQLNRNGLFSVCPAWKGAIWEGWSVIEPSGRDDMLRLRDALNTLFADPESQEYRGDLDPLEGGE